MSYFSPSYYPLYIVGGIFALVTVVFSIWIVMDVCSETRISKKPITVPRDNDQVEPHENVICDETPRSGGGIQLEQLDSSDKNRLEQEKLPDENLEDLGDRLPNVMGGQNPIPRTAKEDGKTKKILNPDIYVNPLIGREGPGRYPRENFVLKK